MNISCTFYARHIDKKVQKSRTTFTRRERHPNSSAPKVVTRKKIKICAQRRSSAKFALSRLPRTNLIVIEVIFFARNRIFDGATSTRSNRKALDNFT